MSVQSQSRKAEAPAGAFWPQVDLLPREVVQARELSRLKRLLAFVLLAAVLVVGLGYVAGLLSLNEANGDLSKAQATTALLTAEQEKYAEVPRVQGQIRDTTKARQDVTVNEVLWQQYVEALRTVTPAEVSFDVLQATVVGPEQPAAEPTDPLQAPSVGQILFQARAESLPDLAAWMDAVDQVPGFSDPWYTQAASQDEEGKVYYQIDGTVQVDATAFEHRFDAQNGEK